jgi:hypothetical protein
MTWFHDDGIGYFPVKVPIEIYDQAYFDKYAAMAETQIGRELNEFRVKTVQKFYSHDRLVDIGIGSGTFIEAMTNAGRYTLGYDINPIGIEWLNNRNLLFNPYASYPQAISCWDSLEHIECPELLLNRVRQWVFISIPIFRDLDHVMDSKHFRTDEHFWYFTHKGLVIAMKSNGFTLEWFSTMETALGREDIGTFVFRRV